MDNGVDEVTPDRDRDQEQSVEVPSRQSGASASQTKVVTGVASRFMEMSVQQHEYKSFACGIMCGLKKNPHVRRIRRLQDGVSNLTGMPSKGKKQPKSPPFQDIFERLNEDLGISVMRYSGELEKDAREYSESPSESMTINLKSVAKALKKIDRSVGTLLKDVNRASEKLDRDLSEKPKYDPENWENWKEDKDKMKTMRKNLKEVIKVVEDWKKQIKKCTELLAKAKKGDPKDIDIRTIKENCHTLKKTLEKEMHLMHKPKSETKHVPERDSLTNI